MRTGRKIYVMSVACTGKTTFAARTPYLAGCRIVDSEELLPEIPGIVNRLLFVARVIPWLRTLLRCHKVLAARHDEYYKRVFEFLRAHDEPVAVLGRPGPEDLSPYGDITFGAVLIPWEEHRQRYQQRRRELRNPLPFLHHRSTNPDRLKALREHLAEYARSRRIPVFESLAEAVSTLSRQTPLNRERAADFSGQRGIERGTALRPPSRSR
jgi:hypothetical protein